MSRWYYSLYRVAICDLILKTDQVVTFSILKNTDLNIEWAVALQWYNVATPNLLHE